MIRRFGLYGFLKNQRYFEFFWVLAFLEKGLSFFEIGLLFGFREIVTNVMEIPSGAIADLWGRRRAMILSHFAYIISFTLFGFAVSIPLLFAAMFFFAVGDAFRTGTHKAMIFTWLRIHGRTDERVRTYGMTRSWSKTGSAVAVIVATGLVFMRESYTEIFFFSIIPYVFGVANLLSYPSELDGDPARAPASLAGIARHLRDSLVTSLRRPALRGLILESMGFEGFFKAAKDFLQPILKSAATLWLAGGVAHTLSPEREAALLIGPVYVLLFIFAAAASRNAHRIATHAQSLDRAAARLWRGALIVFLILLPGMIFDWHIVMIAGFVALHVLQNFWRPVLISRFDEHSSEAAGATVLSIESQAKTFATMICAPLLGLAVDLARNGATTGGFWPIGLTGLLITGAFALRAGRIPAH